MNPVAGVFHDFVQLFERLNVPYAVMGGLAVRAHGIPRPTYDVDLAILIDRQQLAAVINEIRQLGYDVAEQYDKGWVDTVCGLPFIKAATFIEGRSLVADIFLAETDFLRSLISRRLAYLVNLPKRWIGTLTLVPRLPWRLSTETCAGTFPVRLQVSRTTRWRTL